MASVLDDPSPQSNLEPAPAELAERLRETILRDGSPGASAALGAVELAVAIQGAVSDPAGNVFWDSADHARPFAMLMDGSVDLTQINGPPGRALSDAVGAAAAQTLRNAREPVVCVIDGMSLSTGLAFEAVNHAGHLQLPLVLVLLDAQSARGRGVGVMGRYLARIRGHARYADAKATIEQALGRIPAGEQAVEVARRLKNSVRELLVPTEMWEELLGFIYLGPVDGHNLSAMCEIVALAVAMRRPVVIHVAAESGRTLARRRSAGQSGRGHPAYDWLAAAETSVREAMRRDDRVVALTTDASGAARMARVGEEFPERYFEVPQGETHAVAFAASVAAQGLLPTVAVRASRLVVALSAVAAECAAKPVPVTLLVHADEGLVRDPIDLRIACAVEGLAVTVPAAVSDVEGLLARARATGGWTLVRLPSAPDDLDADASAAVPEGVRAWPGPHPGPALVAAGPVIPAVRMAAGRLGCTAVGVTRLAPFPQVNGRWTGGHWVLALDDELGPCLRRAWPPELVSRTTIVELGADLEMAAQADAITAAARSLGTVQPTLPPR